MKNWSYLAGLVDGEGHISVHKDWRKRDNCAHYEAVLSIVNTDLRLMKWLISHFGGRYYTQPAQGNWKSRHAWRVTGAKNKEEILLGILPHLVLKKEQAQLLLTYLRLNDEKCPELREEYYSKLAVLNRRGNSVETNTLDTMIESELYGDMQSTPQVTAAV